MRTFRVGYEKPPTSKTNRPILDVTLGAAFSFECVTHLGVPLGATFSSECVTDINVPIGAAFSFECVTRLSVPSGGGRGRLTHNPEPQPRTPTLTPPLTPTPYA